MIVRGHLGLPLFVSPYICSSHCMVKNLCNQFLPHFSKDLFEILYSFFLFFKTLCTFCGHNEDVHMEF